MFVIKTRYTVSCNDFDDPFAIAVYKRTSYVPQGSDCPCYGWLIGFLAGLLVTYHVVAFVGGNIILLKGP